MNQSLMDGARSSRVARAGGRRTAAVVILGLSLLGIGWYLSRSRAATSASTPGALPLVTVMVPAIGEIRSTVSVTGLLSARNDIPIGNEGDAARIAEVLVEPGDHVRQGQVLARLDSVAAQSLVRSAQASLEEARANDLAAQAEWERAQRGPDLFSKEEDERRRTAAATTRAKVDAAQAQLIDARNKLAHTLLVAPCDGVVLTRAAEVGQIAVPGSSILFRIGREGRVELRGQIAEQDIPRLKVGQSATIRLVGLDTVFDGVLWQIGAIIDPATRQGTVRIALSSVDSNLRPGAFARGEIQVGSTRGAILPQTAVLGDEHGTYVLVVGSDHTVQRREVTVAGARSSGLLISRGLTGDERIVAIAAAFLRVGEPVNVVSSPEERSVGGSGARALPDAVSAQ